MSENRFQIFFRCAVTGFVSDPSHGTKYSPAANVNEDTEAICVRKSVPNTFRECQNTTDDDLDTIQITASVMTEKQPNSGSTKITINNNKSFQCV